MKKILIIGLLLLGGITLGYSQELKLFSDETSISNRVNIGLNISGYSPKNGFKHFWDYYDFDGSKSNLGISAGYSLWDFAEIGLDFNHFGNFKIVDIVYIGDEDIISVYDWSVYLKLAVINANIAPNAVMQLYLKASYGRLYQEEEYKYSGTKLKFEEDWVYYSYGGGIDFNIGENRNLILGLEYRMHNGDGDAFAASTGMNLGWRFGSRSKAAINSEQEYLEEDYYGEDTIDR